MQIDFRMNDKGVERAVCSGSNIELAVAIGILVNLIYSAALKSDREAAESIKAGIKAITSPDAPTWTPRRDIEGIFITQEVKK